MTRALILLTLAAAAIIYAAWNADLIDALAGNPTALHVLSAAFWIAVSVGIVWGAARVMDRRARRLMDEEAEEDTRR